MNLTKGISQLISKALHGERNRDLILHSSFALIIRTAAAISSIIMNIIVAQQLGAFDSGNFFLSWTILIVLSTIVRMGGDNLLIRYIGIYESEKNWKQIHYIFNKITIEVLLLSTLTMAILLILNKFISLHVFNKKDLEPVLLWMVLSLPLTAINSLFAFAFQGLRNVLLSVSIQNIFIPLLVSCNIFFFKINNAEQVAQSFFGATLLTFAISLFFWKIKVPNNKEKGESIPNLREKNYVLWIYSIFVIAIQWSGQFITGIYSSQNKLAQLAVCQRISFLINFVLIAVNLVSAPQFAKLYQQKKLVELEKYYQSTTKLMIIFATPLILLIWIFPLTILKIFGTEFEEGIWLLRILSIGQFINVASGSVGYLLLMSGHEKDVRNITILSGIISIIINIIFINFLDVLGSAFATAMSIIIQNMIALQIMRKRLGFKRFSLINKT